MRLVISTVVSTQLTDFWRLHAVIVVISWKQSKIESLLQTTDRKWYMVYRRAEIQMTLSEFQGHSPTASLFKCDFRFAVQQLTRFQLTYSASRGPSAIVELLVSPLFLFRCHSVTLEWLSWMNDSFTYNAIVNKMAPIKRYTILMLLLARLYTYMYSVGGGGQTSNGRWCLASSVVVVCRGL